jgi:Zn finger protein HypA/HybF involved in hydrogenase expression
MKRYVYIEKNILGKQVQPIQKESLKEGIMPIKNLNPYNLGLDEDWEGNNAAFKCPHCNKEFIVSALIHRGGRSCPNCHKSTGYCDIKGKKGGGTASIEW